MTAYVLLEDGTRFDGDAVGADTHAVGEVVFTTGMSGYQESMTDPSFAGQLITFTYPHIGNYGVRAAAMESDRPWARAAIMREANDTDDAPGAEDGWLRWLRANGIPAITGVDTRSLVLHIRDEGAMRGGVFPGAMPEAQARELIEAEPSMVGRDLVQDVTPRELTIHGEGDGPRIVAIDTGIKGSIVRNFTERGAIVELHPARTSAEELLARGGDAIFLANGPGDPAALGYVVDTLRELVGRQPTFGICLGHQLLCRAVGLDTFKLPFGHRGGNHPVKDLETGRIEITSQNHGFAVLGPNGEQRIEADEAVRWTTDFGEARLSHVNLYDRTVEGLTLLDVAGGTVQYHPEAGPARTTPCTSSTASWRPSVPRRDDLRRIMILGSGPIVIGQAAEFDYSGVQACKVLREEGYEVVLVNSNPATIMTDPEFADATYVEPLRPDVVRQIIEKERPDALLPTLGGQTALNIAMDLDRSGVLDELGVELIGAKGDAIERAEDRDIFRRTMEEAGLRVPRSAIAHTLAEAEDALIDLGLPIVVRPATRSAAAAAASRARPTSSAASSRRASRRRRSRRCCSTSRCSAGASSSSRSCATTTTTS